LYDGASTRYPDMTHDTKVCGHNLVALLLNKTFIVITV